MELHSWTNLAADGSIRVLKYSFGFGTANTLAARLDDGSWLVVSPAIGLPASALDALGQDGDVSALVAPNGFHHLGQATWRARFPKAVSYAPEGALARLAKKAAAVPFRSLGELTLPARIGRHLPEGMKVPDLLLSVRAGDGAVWFVGDLISNTVAGDVKGFPGFMFRLLGGGPGYRFNKVPTMVYLRDKKAWKASVRALFEQTAPTAVVPAHGDPITDDAAAKTRAILA